MAVFIGGWLVALGVLLAIIILCTLVCVWWRESGMTPEELRAKREAFYGREIVKLKAQQAWHAAELAKDNAKLAADAAKKAAKAKAKN